MAFGFAMGGNRESSSMYQRVGAPSLQTLKGPMVSNPA
jgi:hypothetical protein